MPMPLVWVGGNEKLLTEVEEQLLVEIRVWSRAVKSVLVKYA